jgi:hypothetical protein
MTGDRRSRFGPDGQFASVLTAIHALLEVMGAVTTFGRTIAGGAVLLATAGALAFACSAKSTSGAARVDGTVARTGLLARSAIAHGALGLGIQLKISDKLNTCSADHELGATELLLTFAGSTIVAGTYDAGVVQGGQVEANFRLLNSLCSESLLRNSTGGTVTITSVSGTTLAGSFDLLFDVDHIGGEFSAYLCPDALGEGGLPFGPSTASAPTATSPLGRLDGGVVFDPEAGVPTEVADAGESSSCQP